MSVQINVEGGTGAGKRIVKELPSWRCRCLVFGHDRWHPGTHYACPDCRARRPK